MIEEGKNELGAFHIKDEDIKRKATTEGHFAPLFRRIDKISTALDDVMAHQNFERQKENSFMDYQ